MTRLLHVVGSPMGELSFSRRAAEAFVAAWEAGHPGGTVDTLDLWETELPEFGRTASAGKFKLFRDLPHTDEEAEAWSAVEAMARHFAGADRYVLSCGMWNFGVPYRLKHYLDVIVQPRLTFDPATGQGLVTGRPVQLVLASGGRYEEGAPGDHQLPYLQKILGYVGFTDIRVLRVQGTSGPPEATAAALSEAIEVAREAAAGF